MKQKLCVIGEALIDFIPQRKGCSLQEVEGFTRVAGGAPANVAGAVAKMADTRPIACGDSSEDRSSISMGCPDSSLLTIAVYSSRLTSVTKSSGAIFSRTV